ncbi:hypothetical protein NDU88_000467 [Pleurodeles waltl]|uniref:Uncharacterized protein n=1 Tax=Pleurodeles waltl TaxID=8319 RepID=A0AAV7SWR5_PLEWA|nr:hypothetical protein NDU88_000467 [Pleurodeles waltl]
MCRLTRGAEKGTVGSGVAVLCIRAALELRMSRLAVARFPLRGRSSSSGRVSTSTLLALKQRTEDGAYAAEVRGGGFTGRTTEETVGLARGRRKRGERSLCSNKEGCATGEVNIKGKSQSLMMEDGEEIARSSPIEAMIVKLTEEIKKGFSVSEANQVSIREACKILETKFDLLAKRTQLLEETVESLKEDVVLIKQDLWQSRVSEQELQDKLERLENAARRNNLRILNIPEGVEGDDIKLYIASLIKNTLQLEETEKDIATDIQRVHREPFRRDPGRKKHRKVVINLQTYALKEKILSKALKSFNYIHLLSRVGPRSELRPGYGVLSRDFMGQTSSEERNVGGSNRGEGDASISIEKNKGTKGTPSGAEDAGPVSGQE